MSGRVTPAVTALERAGVAHRVLEYEHGDGGAGYAQEAADALGLDPARVLKTLVVALGGDPARLAVVVAPATAEVDLRAAAGALGAKKAALAEVGRAERATGYVQGGISPLGQRKRLPTVVDASAVDHPTVYVSAGRRGLELELDPTDLVTLTDAQLAPVTRT